MLFPSGRDETRRVVLLPLLFHSLLPVVVDNTVLSLTRASLPRSALEVALGPLSSLKGSLEITVLVAMLITLVGASRLLARPAPKVAKKEKGEEKVAKHD